MPCPAAELPEPPVGFVLEVQGEWRMQGAAGPVKLQQGQALAAGTRVYRLSEPANTSASSHRLVIARLDGEPLMKWPVKEGVSGGPSALEQDSIMIAPSRRPRASFSDRVYSALAAALFGQKDRYATTLVRGAKAPLAESVLLLKEGVVDFTQLLAPLPEGAYHLRLSVLAALPGEGTAKSAPIRLDHRPGQQAKAGMPGGKPGLYIAKVVELDDGDWLPTGAEAWILLCDSHDFPAKAAQFQQLKDLANEWQKNSNSPAEIRSFLRASLEAISTEHGR